MPDDSNIGNLLLAASSRKGIFVKLQELILIAGTPIDINPDKLQSSNGLKKINIF